LTATKGAVDQPRDDLFAGAGLAADQHRGLGIGDLVDPVPQRLHARVLADHRGARRRTAGRGGGQAPAQHRGQRGRTDWLGDDLDGAGSQGLDRAGPRPAGRERHRRQRRAAGVRLHDDRRAAFGRQPQIDQAEVEPPLTEAGDRVGRARAADRLTA
jgi:hypothetical protein